MTPPYGAAGCRCFYWDRHDVPGVTNGTWGWEVGETCPHHSLDARIRRGIQQAKEGRTKDLGSFTHHDEARLCPTWGAVPVAVGDAVSFECRCAYGCAWVGEIGPHGHVLDDEGDPVCFIEALGYEKEKACHSASPRGPKRLERHIRDLKRWLISSKRTRNDST